MHTFFFECHLQTTLFVVVVNMLLLTLLIFNVSCFVQKVNMKTMQWLKLIVWNECNNIIKQKNMLAMHTLLQMPFANNIVCCCC